MKLLNIIVFLLFSSSLISQTPQTSSTTVTKKHCRENAVPSAIVEKFKLEYPNEIPMWFMDNENYRATFIDSKMANGHAVAYDKKGNVVYREEQLAKGDYPEQIDNYLAKNYPQDKYGVWSSMDRSGTRRYFSEHKDSILWFDEKGNYIKAVDATASK